MSIIALKIDVSKIDKNKLYKGKKGTYLDAVLFLNTEQDQYGNHGMITQSVSQEERAQGVKGAILGNCKVIKGDSPNTSTSQAVQAAENLSDEGGDGLPF